MSPPKYKLGAQLFPDYGEPSDKPVSFEWNLCYMADGRAIAYVPLGIWPQHAPIVKAARDLVKLLNGE